MQRAIAIIVKLIKVYLGIEGNSYSNAKLEIFQSGNIWKKVNNKIRGTAKPLKLLISSEVIYSNTPVLRYSKAVFQEDKMQDLEIVN